MKLKLFDVAERYNFIVRLHKDLCVVLTALLLPDILEILDILNVQELLRQWLTVYSKQ